MSCFKQLAQLWAFFSDEKSRSGMFVWGVLLKRIISSRHMGSFSIHPANFLCSVQTKRHTGHYLHIRYPFLKQLYSGPGL
jgi:hypothetical protein